MKDLFTVKFDNELLDKIEHYQRFPEMLPFIGKNWEIVAPKTLLIGESHYIDSDSLPKNCIDNWYQQNSREFTDYLKEYINTRIVINQSEHPNDIGHRSPYTIFYSLNRAIVESLIFEKIDNQVFQNFSFINYFQRPSFKEGESIVNDNLDNEIAFQNLVELVSIISPNKIIFISVKSYDAFIQQNNYKVNNEYFKDVKIDYVPHAATSHWNMTRKKYGNRTGKEKFIHLLKI